ncbi:MAG: class I SAM-dependent methyltransferase [Chloroflexi bacterium]|nr:class I SAM-dependent methyltransferase [Chloroflexota bacterium]
MSRRERLEWETRYGEPDYQPEWEPSPLLVEWASRLPKGRALDLACGAGRNAFFLAGQGYEVDALDIASAGLALGRQRAQALGLSINWVQTDLDTYALPAATYDVVVVCFYMNLPLAPALVDALKPCGVLVYEHHLRVPGASDGPRNPEHRFAPGELRQLFPSLQVLDYQEGVFNEAGRQHAHARLVAQKPSP